MDTGENNLRPLSEFSVTETKADLPKVESVTLPSGEEVKFVDPSTLNERMAARREILDSGVTLGGLMTASIESRAAAKQRLFITGKRSTPLFNHEEFAKAIAASTAANPALLGISNEDHLQVFGRLPVRSQAGHQAELATDSRAGVVKTDRDSYILAVDPAAASPTIMSTALAQVGEDGTVKSCSIFQPSPERKDKLVSELYLTLPQDVRHEISKIVASGDYAKAEDVVVAAAKDPHFFKRRLLQKGQDVQIKGVHLKQSGDRKYQNSSVSGAFVSDGRFVDQSLVGVNPFDPSLSKEVKMAMFRECAKNPWYFYNIIQRSFDAGSNDLWVHQAFHDAQEAGTRDYLNQWIGRDDSNAFIKNADLERANDPGDIYSPTLSLGGRLPGRNSRAALIEAFNRDQLIEQYCGLHIPVGSGGLEAACKERNSKFLVYRSGEVIEMAYNQDGTTRRLTQEDSCQLTTKLNQGQDLKSLYRDAARQIPGPGIDPMVFYRTLYLNTPRANRHYKLPDMFGGKGVIVAIDKGKDVDNNRADMIMDLEPIMPSSVKYSRLKHARAIYAYCGMSSEVGPDLDQRLLKRETTITTFFDSNGNANGNVIEVYKDSDGKEHLLLKEQSTDLTLLLGQGEGELQKRQSKTYPTVREAAIGHARGEFESSLFVPGGPFHGFDTPHLSLPTYPTRKDHPFDALLLPDQGEAPLGKEVLADAQRRHDELPRGSFSVGDSELFAKPILRGYGAGIQSLHDQMVGSRDVAKELLEKPVPGMPNRSVGEAMSHCTALDPDNTLAEPKPAGYTPDVVDPAIDVMAATRNFLK